MFFASHLTCVLIAGGLTCASNLPEMKPYLSEHQNAWKAIDQERPFVLYQRSFEHDPAYAGDCIQGVMIGNEPEKQYGYGFVHWRTTKDEIVNTTVYLFAETSEGYKTPNVYVPSPINVKLFNTQYIFVATEYDNCDILRAPHHNNGCEMWVLLEKVKEINSLCHFIYDLLCGPEKFMVYDPESCGNVSYASQ